ncbi:alpha/beta hydrolase [Pontimicrobium aquaticum]|uniref:Alpha/beta hydrolase n=1 Tax=Pontimicrobium aquaticum TaxID=2565367 RepID=A0A4U0EWB4_9FLAO|nr:alpha/beta hydrolase [Pontimicrobium aquaticum]TJY36048.1 alpha/beta hydrolase [Pontimicrobium aquaticum]
MRTVGLYFLLMIITIKPFLIMAQQEDIKINSRVDGKMLNITHLKPKHDSFNEAILFIHGASFPSELASGFKMNGVSWTGNLSEAGYNAFSLDFLGYGKSDRYNYMSDKGTEFANNSGGIDVIEDIDIAIDFILKKLQINKVHLIGHSWGAAVSGYYSTIHPEKIDKLVLFAPVAQRIGPTSWSKPIVSYIDLTPKERIEQFISGIPEGKQMTLEDEIFTKWKIDWLKSDPTATNRNPASIRYPSAWKKDLYNCWNGKCFFEASKIKNSTLLIRGEWDTVLNKEDANKIFMEMKKTPFKKYIIIKKGTHVMHLEKSRHQLYAETLFFLKTKINIKK